MIPIRIVMADDHEIFRDGFAGMFANHPEIELVDQAPDGQYLVSSVEKHRPDVVLTDIQMPNMSGPEATRIIMKRFPATAVIAMSSFENYKKILEMLDAGAVGYLVKNAKKDVVMEAIRSAFQGENYYCRDASSALSAVIASGKYNPHNPGSLDFKPVEERIIRLICEGMDSQQIAEELKLNLESVKKYRKSILEKAGVNSIAALAVFAIRNGIYVVL